MQWDDFIWCLVYIIPLLSFLFDCLRWFSLDCGVYLFIGLNMRLISKTDIFD
jgi:hypothetical protein